MDWQLSCERKSARMKEIRNNGTVFIESSLRDGDITIASCINYKL